MKTEDMIAELEAELEKKNKTIENYDRRWQEMDDRIEVLENENKRLQAELTREKLR